MVGGEDGSSDNPEDFEKMWAAQMGAPPMMAMKRGAVTLKDRTNLV